MELIVQGKQVNVGDALRTHVTDRLEDIEQKYFNHTTDATVTFSREGHGHGQYKVHISFRVGKNIMIVTEATESDPYVSFDSAAEKTAKRLRRYKKKLRDHHARTEKTPEAEILKARDYILAVEPEREDSGQDNKDDDDGVPHGEDPVVIAEMTMNIETLSVSEAVMRMDLAGQTALLFRNASHDGLNMIYRRPDGNVGWVDPEGNNATTGRQEAVSS